MRRFQNFNSTFRLALGIGSKAEKPDLQKTQSACYFPPEKENWSLESSLAPRGSGHAAERASTMGSHNRNSQENGSSMHSKGPGPLSGHMAPHVSLGVPSPHEKQPLLMHHHFMQGPGSSCPQMGWDRAGACHTAGPLPKLPLATPLRPAGSTQMKKPFGGILGRIPCSVPAAQQG